jgi:putative acetyltransferase
VNQVAQNCNELSEATLAFVGRERTLSRHLSLEAQLATFEDMSKITIRSARDSDARAFLETLNRSIREVACADYSAEVIESWAVPISPKSLSRYAENPEGELRVIAEIDGKPVGIGATVISKSELRACYVAPEGLRQGVGTAIVSELERIGKAAGLDHFHLHGTVTAEPFYNALGYQSLQRIVHITRGGARIAAVTMRKDF